MSCSCWVELELEGGGVAAAAMVTVDSSYVWFSYLWIQKCIFGSKEGFRIFWIQKVFVSFDPKRFSYLFWIQKLHVSTRRIILCDLVDYRQDTARSSFWRER